ncbi:MAG: hypothetical protein M3Q29_12955 [Chloroflexota bacterium]|nr:hypothetical protein [Chloroflexota bacterium]
MQTHGGEWHRYFASLGYTDAHPLAAGIEGAVYRLGSGLIGKVWARDTSLPPGQRAGPRRRIERWPRRSGKTAASCVADNVIYGRGASPTIAPII